MLKLARLREDAISPFRATEHSSGLDLSAPDGFWLDPGETKAVPLGWACELQPGYEAQIRSRSGLALKCGVVVLNSPGSVDADFRGELAVILHNHSSRTMVFKRGDRIAQLVGALVWLGRYEEVEPSELSPTERKGGLGSTGA